jgi:peptidyl-prolyl cis-trans isomerase SurA
MTKTRHTLIPLLAVFAFLSAFAAAPSARAQQTGLGIAAVVNDDVISMLDMHTRASMIISSTNMQDSPETRQRILPQVLRSLIDEKLMMQEARDAGITVSKAEIEDGIARIARGNNMTPLEMTNTMQSFGVPVSALEARVETEIAWARFVGQRLSRTIKIGEEEINAEIERIKNNAGKPEYLLAEIVLPVDKPDQDGEVRLLAQRLLQQMKAGAPFSALASNFSRAPSAAVGGDMGWIQPSHLEEKLVQVIQNLRPGQVSMPVRTISGYTIVMVRDVRTSPGLSQGEATLKVSQLHLNAANVNDPQEMNALAARLSTLTAGIGTCAQLEAVGAQQGSPLSGAMGEINLSSLPETMRTVLEPLPVGQISRPVTTGGGLAVMMVCERTAAENAMDQVRETIAQRLRTERLDVAAQRQLRDLRRAAFVDIRL